MKKLITKSRVLASASSAISAVVLFAGTVAAGPDITPVPKKLAPVNAGISNDVVANTISRAIVYILGFSAAIATVFLIFGGIKYVVSQGNSESIEGAKHTIMYSIIGLVVIALSYVIVKYAGSILPGILLGT